MICMIEPLNNIIVGTKDHKRVLGCLFLILIKSIPKKESEGELRFSLKKQMKASPYMNVFKGYRIHKDAFVDKGKPNKSNIFLLDHW